MGRGLTTVPWSAKKEYVTVEQAFETSLDDLIDAGSLSPSQAAQLTFHLLRTLRAVHRTKLIHGDIRPHHIRFNGDWTLAEWKAADPQPEPYLIDFGDSVGSDGKCDGIAGCLNSFLLCSFQTTHTRWSSRNAHRRKPLWEIDDVETVLYSILRATGKDPWVELDHDNDEFVRMKEEFWSRASKLPPHSSELPFPGFEDIAKHVVDLGHHMNINYVNYAAFEGML
jgi:hypothetical protein